MKTAADHLKHGFVGTSFFWIKIALILIPVVTLIYSALIASYLGNGLYKKAVGTASISCHILLLIFSVCSIVTAILYNFNLVKLSILSYVHYIVTAIGIMFNAICLTFLSPTAYYSAYNSVSEYATQFSSADPQAAQWVNYTTSGNAYQAYYYVIKRTIKFYLPMRALFTLWLGTFFISMVQSIYLKEKISHEEVTKENINENQ